MSQSQQDFQPEAGGIERLILYRLDSIEERLSVIDKRLHALDLHVAGYKAQAKLTAGIVGCIAGAIPAIISIIIAYA